MNISDAFESYGLYFLGSPTHLIYIIFRFEGAFTVGTISDDERFDVVRHACPGAGACGGMYTANTMSSALEVRLCVWPLLQLLYVIQVLGMSLPYSSSTPATFPRMLTSFFLSNRSHVDLRLRENAGVLPGCQISQASA